MPSAVGWLIENRIVHVRYFGVVNAEDVRRQTADTLALIERGVAPVHVYIDASAIDSVSVSIGDLRGLAVPTMPDAGWMLVVAPNALYRFFISVAAQFSRGSYKFVRSEQDALDFAREQDPTLPPVS
jgi:hypothetical protein